MEDRLAINSDIETINLVIEHCVMQRPVSDRIKKLTLPSLYLEEADLEMMVVRVAGDPIVGVFALQSMNSGALLHSLYVDPVSSGNGLGYSLIRAAMRLSKEAHYPKLIVKAFPESVGFFERVGFKASKVLDYPHTLEMSITG